MKPQRIAYIQLGSFSHANHYIVHSLRRHFPDYEIDIIDVAESLRARKHIRLINLLYTLKEYGTELLLRRRALRECMYHTSYIFKKMSDWSRAAMDQKEYSFSFQTQSMFDASRADMDHFVYTDHTLLAHLRYPHLKNKRSYVVSKAWVALEAALYNKAATTFTMSKFVEASLQEDYNCPSEKVVCAGAGANVETASAVLIAKYTRKEILFVGVHWKRKGGPELLKAFKLVLQEHPDARLTIVGCEPPIEPSLLRYCRVLGKISTPEVIQLYEQASIFCLPTTLEPFGFVFIEAMLHKLPVVTTNVGAIPDFLEDGVSGYMVEPGDINGLANALIDLLHHPEKCLKFGKAAHRAVDHKYTWDAAITKIKERIVQITGKSTGDQSEVPTQVEATVSHRSHRAADEPTAIGHRRDVSTTPQTTTPQTDRPKTSRQLPDIANTAN